MKHLNKSIIYLLAILLFAGCADFEEINTNPDKPTTVPASMLATKIINTMMAKGGNKYYVNDCLVAKLITYNEGTNDNQYNNIGRGSFDNFIQVTNCNDMIVKGDGLKGYEGLALFAKAYFLYYISMDMGDIPYSEVGQGLEGNTRPKYDAQADVMAAILTDLEKSYAAFSEAGTTAFDGDIIFNGDREKWKKTVTAFQLKVLINLSKKESDATLNVKQRFANCVQNGALMTSNADNYQLTYKNQAGMKYPFNDDTSNQTKYAMLSSVVIDQLKAFDDYRLFYYGEPAIAKIDDGLAADDFDAYVGIDPSWPFGDISTAFGNKLSCALNLRYTEVAHTEGEPLIRLGYSEQQFILAEACLRGWISGNAADYYKRGIKAHMTFVRDCTPVKYAHGRELTDTYIDNYLASAPIQLTGNFDGDLKQIITQKYLAYFMQFAQEAYYDYRRTGYPVLPINPQTNMNSTAPDRIPVRYRYPTNEYNYNRESLEAALDRQFNGDDDNNGVMWILK
ncbi:MAG: SusD/RagB family nutrient-binding outer membrane lipoprotein [Prevotellaceae bacterium]|jgi:hypothetical protein|nr:SusD/RagB family nutrient-binding outer membrane lipoprotein [Prevotellaceae bacterium]